MDRVILKTIIKLKRANADTWNSLNPILEEGEPGFVIDQNKIKIGDGITTWKNLPYLAGGESSIQFDIQDPQDGEILHYDASTGKWVNTSVSEGAVNDVKVDGVSVVDAGGIANIILTNNVCYKVELDFNEDNELIAKSYSKDGTLLDTSDGLDISALADEVVKKFEDGEVSLPIATESITGVVKSSTDKNKVAVSSNGEMNLNQIGIEKLSDTDGVILVLEGGLANTL